MLYLSLAAEAFLIALLGVRSPWGRYLAFDVLRAIAVSNLPASNGWSAIVWIVTEPVTLILQYLAVAPVLAHGARSRGGFADWMLYLAGLIGVALTFWVSLGDASGFMLKHHAMVMAHRAAVLILFLALVLSESVARFAGLTPLEECRWLLAYYALQTASIAAMGALGPGWIRPLNTAHAAIVTLLFAAWGIRLARTRGTVYQR